MSWDSEAPINVTSQWKRFYNNSYNNKNLKILKECCQVIFLLAYLDLWMHLKKTYTRFVT